MLRIEYAGKQHSPAMEKKLRKEAVDALLRGGGFSASGITAFFAIEYCLENKLGFILQAGPEGGYSVHLLDQYNLVKAK